MKKTVALLVACLLMACGTLIGCSQPAQESSASQYQDQAFLADLGKALEARWQLGDQQKTAGDESSKSSNYKKCVQAELDILNPYRSATFENTKLQELAIRYLNSLDDQMEAAEKYSSTSYESSQAWNDAYDKRTMVLNDIASDFEIKVSPAKQNTLDDLLNNGKAAQTASDNEATVQSLANAINIEFAQDGYGYVTGKATAANTSDLNFEHASFNVQLYDAAGVRTVSSYLSINNWRPGETVVDDVYVGDSEIPASYKIEVSNYSLAK